MQVTTIENDGQPWVVCKPFDPDELQRFLNASASSAVGAGFTTRPANPREASRWSAAHAIHVFEGGDADSFFAISA